MNKHNKDEPHINGLICFHLMLQYLKQTVDIEVIQHEFCPDGGDITPDSIIRASKKLKLRARKLKIKPDRLKTSNFPLIAETVSGDYFLICAVNGEKVLIQQGQQVPETITVDDLWQRWQGHAIAITSRDTTSIGLNKFDLSWFIPAIVKFRYLLRDVVIASFFIQLFALFIPLIFQVVMDKVLVHRAEMTLNVLVIALVMISVFEVVLSGLRTYVFSHTTNRIDVELGSQLFQHMMSLPIAFFQSRAVGQVVARVRELENVRNFLTSSTLTLVIDLFFSFVFIAVMFFYSARLAWIVVASIPVYILISVLITPSLRRRTEEQFQKSALNYAFLTESLSGIETLKSMAIEPQVRHRWEKQLAGYAEASFKAVKIGIYGSQSVQMVSKMVVALLMWQGALEVINGRMTVGELIAFNMLSGQIAAPILRLAQLWQDFQQFRISIERLGDVINSPTEPQSCVNQPSPASLTGHIKLDEVVFRYNPMAPEILHKFSLDIPPGQIIGIAGASGSGKSTLTKLIQRLYIPEQGKVFIDGNNLSLLNPAWVRKQVGVVLQENVLFNASIRDNIAIANPAMNMDKVINSAKLAGAHEFISDLPMGYNTEVGERGIGLSGGQLQRIAIARALATEPTILILDEATSALDYESEKVIQQNMREICRGRTVIIIAHRLSTLCQCDRIVVIEKGTIDEDGTHNDLIRKGGRYAQLWDAQIYTREEEDV